MSRAPGVVTPSPWSLALCLVSAGLAGVTLTAQGQARAPDSGAIYVCTTAAGRRLTSDRPIPECLEREQQVLNKDGSLRMILPPSPTSDERAAQEEAERRRQLEQAARLDAVRRDRNLVVRFPNEEVHNRGRQEALQAVRAAIKASEYRLADLSRERKPLVAEAEFYVGKPLPPKLKARIDAVEAGIAAQRDLVLTQQAELERINANYDAELERLRKLWRGAPPGSLGPLPEVGAASRDTSAPRRP